MPFLLQSKKYLIPFLQTVSQLTSETFNQITNPDQTRHSSLTQTKQRLSWQHKLRNVDCHIIGQQLNVIKSWKVLAVNHLRNINYAISLTNQCLDWPVNHFMKLRCLKKDSDCFWPLSDHSKPHYVVFKKLGKGVNIQLYEHVDKLKDVNINLCLKYRLLTFLGVCLAVC